VLVWLAFVPLTFIVVGLLFAGLGRLLLRERKRR
jgi:hypothetical protein